MKRDRKLYCLLLCCLLSLSVWGQSGVICGTVMDAKLKEPLIGASVMIEGTSKGAITDLDGVFRIEQVKPGVYSVASSYVSYQTQVTKDIPVIAGQEAVLRIELSDANLQLQNVVVVAQRRLGTEMAVLNAVRKSLPVVSGISSQQIGKTQDSDAAEVLRRIPGITVVNDRFIVVRGLAQRYNNVWLNNATTPSSETDSRAFSFDVLPSSLIDNLMIYKSPSPELPADFSGGFVRVLTKNIPEGNTFNIAYQLGFNTQASFRPFQLSKRGSADLSRGVADDAVPFTRQTNSGWAIRHFTALPEQKLTLSMHRSWRVGDVRVGNVTSVNYSNGSDYYEMKNNNYLSYDLANDRPSYRYRYDDRQYQNTTKLGALFNWSFLKGDNKYEFRNFFNQRGTSALSQREGTDFYSDENIRKWESLYTRRTTYAGQLSGEHKLKEEVNKLDWTAGYAFAAYREPDRKVVNSKQQLVEGRQAYYVSDPTRYYQSLSDHSASVSLNYEHKLFVSDLFTPLLNAGLYGEYKNRDFSARRFVYNLLGSGYNRFADWDYSSVFADENLSADRISMKETTNKSDSYTSGNSLGAAYALARLNYGERWNVSVGVRLEYDRLQLDGYESDGVKPVNLDQSSVDLFPSLNMTYSLSEKHQFRLAYGRSVNRAEFREVVPYVYYDFGRDANIIGNVALKNAYATNVDVRYEYYPAPGETVTIGGFFKDFSHPIEQSYYEAGSGLQYTYRNADRAKALGVEVDVKKQLDFIGLKGLSFVLNGAYIYSRVSFAKGAFERDRPMQGQSPYLINTGFFYQHERAGLSASVLYNRIGKRIETVGVAKQDPNDDIPDVYEMPRNALDLSFQKTIGRHVELRAGVKDLLNSKVEYKQFLRLSEAGKAGREVEQLVRSYHPGATVQVGVSVKF